VTHNVVTDNVVGHDDRPALSRLCRADVFDDPEWQTWWRALAIPPDTCKHRKAFEWVQCIYGLESLGALGSECTVLGVGAGHEYPLYYLANRSKLTVATDLYTFAGDDWTDVLAAEADPSFLTEPERFAPFAYRRTSLLPMIADGRQLPFADAAFDVVFSLGSIEHFGGDEHAGAAAAMAEMGRVLRPGGVACVATEYVLAGGPHHEFFLPGELLRDVIAPSGLDLVGPLDVTPPEPDLLAHPISDPVGEHDGTHIVMGVGDPAAGGVVWTSVVLFLRKPLPPATRRRWRR
jgi:SAM-dependent methyltransferase